MGLIALLIAQSGCIHITSSAIRPVRSADTISSEYSRVRSQLVSEYSDWMKASERDGFSDTLDAAWSITAEWAGVYLDSHPDAYADDLAHAIRTLDPPRECPEYDQECPDEYHLDPSAVQLSTGSHAAYAVAVNYPRAGTFFVLARDSTGRFHTAWDIKPLAKKHFASEDEVGYWAYLSFSWGGGPLLAKVGLLPPAGRGRPRFYVDATTAPFGGGTSPKQLSVWEWNGTTVIPVFIKSYLVSIETTPLELEQDTIKIHTKGEYKTFFSCGMCTEPEMVWTIRFTPQTVEDLGRKHVVTELELVDQLLDGIWHGMSVDTIASPQVIEAIKPVVDLVVSDMDSDSTYPLSMLLDWKVLEEDGRKVLYISADHLDLLGCNPLRFELEKGSTALYFTHLDLPESCSQRSDTNSK